MKNALDFILFAVIVVAVIFSLSYGLFISFDKQKVDVEVTNTYVKHKDDKSVYMIATKGEVFKNADHLLLGKANSSDFHANITPGRYEFTVTGRRIPVLSMYRNVISYKRK